MFINPKRKAENHENNVDPTSGASTATNGDRWSTVAASHGQVITNDRRGR